MDVGYKHTLRGLLPFVKSRYAQFQIHTLHELAAVRGIVYLWNFLPPDELNRILSLYERVTHKTLRISKTFGIEGKKLLTPEDDYEALREFNQAYEGTTSSIEEMHLAYQQLVQDYPELAEQARAMPLRVFSGKTLDGAPSSAARAIFFCYRQPVKDVTTGEWTTEAGFTRWYLYAMATGEIEDDATSIFEFIQCAPDTPRQTTTAKPDLIEIRKKLDKHVRDTYLKKVQAPVGVECTLLAWMELV